MKASNWLKASFSIYLPPVLHGWPTEHRSPFLAMKHILRLERGVGSGASSYELLLELAVLEQIQLATSSPIKYNGTCWT